MSKEILINTTCYIESDNSSNIIHIPVQTATESLDTTINYGETERLCAVRELEEETNIVLTPDTFTKAYNIHYKAYYFYTELDKCDVSFQRKIIDNDVNAVGWIKPKCLQKCIDNGNIIISRHCKILFNKFLDIDITESNFIEVTHK